MRITVNGQRIVDQTTNRFIEPGRWQTGGYKVKGNSQDACIINTYLDTLKSKVYACEREIASISS
jgi:hypothetical protein